MRRESERAFQVGGGVVTDEMIENTPGVWVGSDPAAMVGALEEVVTPEPEPEPEPEEEEPTRPGDVDLAGLREMRTMTRDESLAALRAGRESLAERRAKREREDERARWLALAQGMLAPTRTGAFGESLGMTAGALREESERRRRGEDEMLAMEMELTQQERDIEEQYIRDMAGLQQTSTALMARPVGTENLVPHPDNPNQYAYVQQYTDPATGESEFRFVTATDPNTGEEYIPRAIDRLDQQIRAGIVAAEEAAAGRLDRANADIEIGRSAYSQIQRFDEALALLDELEARGGGTGGIQNLMLKFANFFGVNDPTVTTLGEVNRYLGEQVLEGLQNFPGQLSNMELQFMADLESAITKGTDINRALLERGIRIMRGRHRRGIAAATSQNEYGGFLGSPSDLAALGIEDIAAYRGYESQFGETGTEGPTLGAGGIPLGQPGSAKDNPIYIGPGSEKPPTDAWVIVPGADEAQQVN